MVRAMFAMVAMMAPVFPVPPVVFSPVGFASVARTVALMTPVTAFPVTPVATWRMRVPPLSVRVAAALLDRHAPACRRTLPP